MNNFLSVQLDLTPEESSYYHNVWKFAISKQPIPRAEEISANVAA